MLIWRTGMQRSVLFLITSLLLLMCACQDKKNSSEDAMEHGYAYHFETRPDYREWKNKNLYGNLEKVDVNGVSVYTRKPPDYSSLKIEPGVMASGKSNIKIEKIKFDGHNIWREDGILDYQPVPKEVTVQWLRPSEGELYEATLRLPQDLAAVFLTPSDDGNYSPILTILIKEDNEVMVLRTINFNLSDELLVFNKAKGCKRLAD